jgi:hypothetical protein
MWTDQGTGLAGDEFFDASQYAFFGRGSSEDVELGGLDEDDGGEQLDDGDDAISNTGDREGVCTCFFFFGLNNMLICIILHWLLPCPFGCDLGYNSVWRRFSYD